MTSLQIRYLSLLTNTASHLARRQSAVQLYVISAASVRSEDSERCYFVGGYIFNSVRPSKSWRCERSGWKKTVTVSDSSGGNVINCKWTGAWYFKMQPKQHFEILTLLSALSKQKQQKQKVAISSADYPFKKLFIQFIFKRTKHFPFNTHIFNWYQHLTEAREKHVNNKQTSLVLLYGSHFQLRINLVHHEISTTYRMDCHIIRCKRWLNVSTGWILITYHQYNVNVLSF